MFKSKEQSASDEAYKEIQKYMIIVKMRPYFGSIPFLKPQENLQKKVDELGNRYKSDFTWGLSFDPQFIRNLMYHGFLPTADVVSRGVYILLPKLHQNRCLLQFENLHIATVARKKSKKYTITVDQDIDKVIAGCVKQHGESWLHPPLQESFRLLMGEKKRTVAEDSKVVPTNDTVNVWDKTVSMHSVELWDGDELVAGELGYAVGTCYCSLTGFMTVSSSGTIQLITLGKLLEQQGFTLWDFGMELPYKKSLGAKSVPRMQFVRELTKVRNNEVVKLKCESKRNCSEIVHFALEQRPGLSENKHSEPSVKLPEVSNKLNEPKEPAKSTEPKSTEATEQPKTPKAQSKARSN